MKLLSSWLYFNFAVSSAWVPYMLRRNARHKNERVQAADTAAIVKQIGTQPSSLRLRKNSFLYIEHAEPGASIPAGRSSPLIEHPEGAGAAGPHAHLRLHLQSCLSGGLLQ
mmetsp:Transcript_60511/g.113028  ORF Transcript_60511/g.113028 Transcript_60511/m.113028 type:complete len:111 (+) Transcript_60511:85-417(+)